MVDFPETLTNCVQGTGVCAVLPADHATITQDEKTTTYAGLAVLRKDFVAYQLIGIPEIGLETNQNNHLNDNGPSTDPLLVIGGKGFDFGTPSGKTYAFTLLPDINQIKNSVVQGQSISNLVLAPFAGPTYSPKSI